MHPSQLTGTGGGADTGFGFDGFLTTLAGGDFGFGLGFVDFGLGVAFGAVLAAFRRRLNCAKLREFGLTFFKPAI